MSNKDLYQLIPDYLADDLSDSDTNRIEEAMVADPDFRREVERLRLIDREIGNREAHAIRNKLDALWAEGGDAHERSRPIFPATWLIALVAILTLGLIGGIWFFTSKAKQTPAEIYAVFYTTPSPEMVISPEYFVRYRDGDTSRTPATDTLLRTRARAAYAKGDYEEALSLYRSLPEDTLVYSAQLAYERGILELQTGRAAEAVQLLPQAEAIHPYATRWYLGLAYLKMDSVRQAREQFELLSGPGENPWRERALLILDQLPD